MSRYGEYPRLFAAIRATQRLLDEAMQAEGIDRLHLHLDQGSTIVGWEVAIAHEECGDVDTEETSESERRMLDAEAELAQRALDPAA